jgi:hypothetical protein
MTEHDPVIPDDDDPATWPMENLCELQGCIEDHTDSLRIGYLCRTAAGRIELPGGRWIEVRRSTWTDEVNELNSTEERLDIRLTDSEPEELSEDAARQLIAELQFNLDQIAASRIERHRLYAEQRRDEVRLYAEANARR